jgi:hypothetical protein
MPDNIEIDASGMDKMMALYDHMLQNKLGPMMKAEVQRNAPVRTGALRDSVDMSVDRAEHILYITATGDKTRPLDRSSYATYVDLGHEQIAWGHPTGEIRPPTAFMRRALYKRYAGF